jgi:hypothetical protein
MAPVHYLFAMNRRREQAKAAARQILNGIPAG